MAKNRTINLNQDDMKKDGDIIVIWSLIYQCNSTSEVKGSLEHIIVRLQTCLHFLKEISSNVMQMKENIEAYKEYCNFMTTTKIRTKCKVCNTFYTSTLENIKTQRNINHIAS